MRFMKSVKRIHKTFEAILQLQARYFTSNQHPSNSGLHIARQGMASCDSLFRKQEQIRKKLGQQFQRFSQMYKPKSIKILDEDQTAKLLCPFDSRDVIK